MAYLMRPMSRFLTKSTNVLTLIMVCQGRKNGASIDGGGAWCGGGEVATAMGELATGERGVVAATAAAVAAACAEGARWLVGERWEFSGVEEGRSVLVLVFNWLGWLGWC